jgi:UDP-N-acetylglucosamine diphosphorylase/glucosamine-1-phosphate N-acetyltransferase
MDPMIIILAGGMGKRMNSTLPKVLHLLHNEPLIVKIIKQARQINPSKILIVVGKYRDIIQKTIQDYLPDVNVEYVDQKIPLGTGDAIKSCISYLQDSSRKIIILSGDVPLIKHETIKRLSDQTNDCGLIIAEVEEPRGLGRIIFDGSEFHSIVEEKDCNDEQRKIRWINSGIYCIQERHIIKYISDINNNNKQQEYYLTDLLGLIRNDNIRIDTCKLNHDELYQIRGVNDQCELDSLKSLQI